ncbi:TolC family protein [Archangium lipolyticum]|uniref:TolC family protein n=1 Tax=Archangium lipolyticum TaxID=2970465 RepID=UPI00214A1400|nr:TolC family protein [Archangium lipolyticum]
MSIRIAAGSVRRPLSLVLLAALSPLGALAQAPSAPAQSAPQAPTAQPSAVASPAPGTLRTVTLQEALSLAAKQGPDVAAARAQSAVAAAGVRRAWTAWQPELTLSGQFVHSSAAAELDLGSFVQLVGGVFALQPVNPGIIPPPVVISAENSRYATAQISQPLFTPAGVFLIGPAKAGAEAAELGALEAREQVLLAVARTYLGLQGIMQMMDAAREAEQVALQREADARAQLGVGMTVEASLLRAQAETAQARVQLAQLSGQYAQLLAMLGALVGEPVQPAPLETPGPQWVIPSDDQSPWEDTFAVRSASKAVQANEGKVTYDRFSWLPSLAAIARGNYNSNAGFTGKNTTYELVVAASVPLYDRGQRYANLHEDEARLAQARAQYESARARGRANWVAAKANLEAAQAALAQAEAQSQLAARVQQQIAAAFKAGVATSLEMSDADTRRFLAASAAAQARATLEIRRVELVAAAGRIASSLEQAEQSQPR